MSELERVLQELETATAMVTGPAKDLGAAGLAMVRRQTAVAELSRLTGAFASLSQGERETAVRRLRVLQQSAAGIEQWLTAAKSDITAEWNQWSHIYRALGAAAAVKPTRFDYKC